MTPVGGDVQHRNICQRIVAGAVVSNKPSSELLDRSQIVIAGLDAFAIGPQVGEERLDATGSEINDPPRFATIDDRFSAEGYKLHMLLANSLGPEMFLKIVEVFVDRPFRHSRVVAPAHSYEAVMSGGTSILLITHKFTSTLGPSEPPT